MDRSIEEEFEFNIMKLKYIECLWVQDFDGSVSILRDKLSQVLYYY